MLISLLVLSPEQIYVPFWVKHDMSHRGPITLLEPLVVLIGRHKDMPVKRIKQEQNRERGEDGRWIVGERWERRMNLEQLQRGIR